MKSKNNIYTLLTTMVTFSVSLNALALPNYTLSLPEDSSNLLYKVREEHRGDGGGRGGGSGGGFGNRGSGGGSGGGFGNRGSGGGERSGGSRPGGFGSGRGGSDRLGGNGNSRERSGGGFPRQQRQEGQPRQESRRDERREQQPRQEQARQPQPRQEQPRQQTPQRQESQSQEPRRWRQGQEERRNDSRNDGFNRNRGNDNNNNNRTFYRRSELKDVQSSGRTSEGTASNGDRIRYRRDNDGRERVSSVTRHDNRTGDRKEVRFDRRGQRSDIKVTRGNGAVLESHRDRDGHYRVTKNFGDHRVVSYSRRGYIEKSYRGRHDQMLLRRTYVDRISRKAYVRYYYNDRLGYRVYRPSWYFGANFYSGLIVGSAWTPLRYSYYKGWRWYANPWVFHPRNPYAYYFAPYSVYRSPVYWVTDYVIAESLASYYSRSTELAQENAALRQQVDSLNNEISSMQDVQDEEVLKQQQQLEANAVISQEIKEQIAVQVKAELEAQQKQSSVAISDVLSNTNYLFVASDELDVSYTDSSGSEVSCTISEGDIFQLNKAISQGEEVAEIKIKTSKKSEDSCPTGTIAYASVKNLEEMKNEFSARTEAGAKAAYEQQGKNGIPQVSTEAAVQTEDGGDDAEAAIQEIESLENEAKSLSQDDISGDIEED